MGGHRGNVFPGVYNKQSVKLGQRESMCSGGHPGSHGLDLMASLLSPAPTCRALLNMLLHLFEIALATGVWRQWIEVIVPCSEMPR